MFSSLRWFMIPIGETSICTYTTLERLWWKNKQILFLLVPKMSLESLTRSRGHTSQSGIDEKGQQWGQLHIPGSPGRQPFQIKMIGTLETNIPQQKCFAFISNQSALSVQNQPRTLFYSENSIIKCKFCAIVEQKCCRRPLSGALWLLRSAGLLLLLYWFWRWLPLASFSNTTLKLSHHYVKRLSRLRVSWPF